MTTTKLRSVPSAMVPSTAGANRAAGRLRAATWLSVLVLVSVAGASAVGLFAENSYGEPISTASMLRGYDLVNLVIVAPLLAVALLGVRRGSARAMLLWPGMLAAVLYTEAYYLFGTGFNDAFLLHAVVFSAALFAVVLALSGLDVDHVMDRVSRRTPLRWIAGLLAFFAVGLGGMWIFYAAWFTVSRQLPEGSSLVETPTVVHLGFALDLAVLVPAYAMAAVLLWRRAPWGYVLAATMLISGAVHQLAYMVALPFQVNADVPGAVAFDLMEPLFAAAFLSAALALLAGLRRSADSTPVANAMSG